MGARFLLSSGSHKHDKAFTTALASALLEWLLIVMLFVYGLFGYLIAKFAHCCELPVPCLLCSRIDHILGSEKAGFYLDMICGEHKLEISSLIYCHFHEKLVDVRGVCESCLFSFATKDKYNAETYRLLIGKLGEEDVSGFGDDFIPNDNMTESLNLKHCSCCNELCISRRHAQTLLHTKSAAFLNSDLGLPLNREFSQDLIGTKKEVESFDSSADLGRKSEDSLVQYRSLKVTSDSDSEIPMSNSEDVRTLISNDPLIDLLLDSTPVEPFTAIYKDKSVCDKSIDLDILSSEPSEKLHQVLPDIANPPDCPSEGSATIAHGLEEPNWPEVDNKVDLSTSINSTEFRNISESQNDGDIPIDESNTRVEETDISSGNINDVKDAEDLDINEAGVQTLVHKADKPLELGKTQIATDLSSLKARFEHKDDGLQMTNQLELGDAYKLAISSRGRHFSGKLAEQLTGIESSRITSDLKLLLSQLSRGSEFPFNDILSLSRKHSRNLDELKTYDSSTSIEIKLLQKNLSLKRNDSKSSLDRNESGFESLDFSTVSEIEGESELDLLKRQLEHNRKILLSLLKELEEERNASTISANEAMAMITRLQEEKAALQMEASHGLRMMEEQAEYDMKALDKLNKLLTEKEKEIQDLEAELELYRTKYLNESGLDNVQGSALNACPSGSDKIRSASSDSNVSAEDLKTNSQEPLLEPETERKRILKSLNSLEKKLRAFCCNREYSDFTEGDQSVEQGKCSLATKLPEEGQNVRSGTYKNSAAMSEKTGHVSTGSHQTLVRHFDFHKQSESAGAEQGPLILKEDDIKALLNEVSNLSEKLQVLENDQSLIER